MDDIKRPIVISHSRPQIPQKNPNALRNSPAAPRPRRRALKIVLILIILAILGLGGFLLARAANLSGKIFVGQSSSFFSKLTSVVKNEFGGVKLIGEEQGQINVLLLGIGGPGHEGPYLSDTIIVAQIRPKENKATLISIPRDYQVNLGSAGYRKINSAFSEGFTKKEDWNDGGKMIIDAVESMSGLDIPYFAVVDFKGFEKAIDLLGGVDVEIERTFTDYTFPNDATGGMAGSGEHQSSLSVHVFHSLLERYRRQIAFGSVIWKSIVGESPFDFHIDSAK
jgi:LCP family protein required for cell wall assembly